MRPRDNLGYENRYNLAPYYRGTKRLVSVNICSVEGKSAGIFVSKVSPGIFVIKKKMNACYFRKDKTAVYEYSDINFLFKTNLK